MFITAILVFMALFSFLLFNSYKQSLIDEKARKAVQQAAFIMRRHIKDNCGQVYTPDSVLDAMEFVGTLSYTEGRNVWNK